MTRILRKLLTFLQSRCEHPVEAVATDLTENAFANMLRVGYCERCGAIKLAYGPPLGYRSYVRWRRPGESAQVGLSASLGNKEWVEFFEAEVSYHDCGRWSIRSSPHGWVLGGTKDGIPRGPYPTLDEAKMWAVMLDEEYARKELVKL